MRLFCDLISGGFSSEEDLDTGVITYHVKYHEEIFPEAVYADIYFKGERSFFKIPACQAPGVRNDKAFVDVFSYLIL